MAVLVNSEPVAVEQKAVVAKPGIMNETFTKAPLELFQHFGLSPYTSSATDISAVNDISAWAFQEGSLGDGLLNLKGLQRSLGTVAPGERLIDKIHRWVSLQRNIGELRKRQGRYMH